MSGVPQGSRARGSSPSLTERQVTDADYQERVRGLSEIAHERGQSLAQLALAWALRHPAVTTALVGASSVHQLEQNLNTLKNLEFTDEELARIDEFARSEERRVGKECRSRWSRGQHVKKVYKSTVRER